METEEVIVALATPPGMGAIAVIRMSGPQALVIASSVFKPFKPGRLVDQSSHTVHLGHVYQEDRPLDKVLVSIFKAPNSYTGENVVEISCHGSLYIQQQIIQLLLNQGCRMATAGEFTLRAFLNGKMDLSQAEAVADLIASEDQSSHEIALRQMRGGFSDEIVKLRERLLHFASMIELELDFSEEDVEFADRTALKELLGEIADTLERLIASFALGNVLKNGIPVAIVGAPNAGKSTLLNALLKEDKAIVSDIPGTTRDAIEDEIVVQGVRVRFIDTAGLRITEDTVEQIGIARAHEKLASAAVIIYLIDGRAYAENDHEASVITEQLAKIAKEHADKKIFLVVNKVDQLSEQVTRSLAHSFPDCYFISALKSKGIDSLLDALVGDFTLADNSAGQTIVANARHYDMLLKALEDINAAIKGLEEAIASDLLAIDIRQALHHLGEITGEITTEDLLGNIFSSFCIGK